MSKKTGKKRRIRGSQIACICVVTFIVLLFIVINIACVILAPFIDGFLVPSRMDNATRAEGRELAIQIEQEGIVMTKNNGTLPLNRDSISSRVNIFGWDATKWVRSGDGSGRSGTSRSALKYDLLSSMTYRHLKYNEKLISCYRNFRSSDREYTDALHCGADEYCRLYEPSIRDTSIFSNSVLTAAREYSDTAFVVLGRVSGESLDCPKTQYKQVKKGGAIVKDETRTYLDISTEEEELLTYVGANFDKVVVIINSTNVMNLGFMDTIPGLDACLIVSGTGGYGALAILDILYGIVSPSGRTADTYAYDFKSAPSYVTAGMEGLGAYQNAGGLYPTTVEYTSDNKGKNFPQVSYSDYAEDIYVGYKWYETADAEGYFDSIDNEYGKGYDGVVQYPFGYGLSYTTFQKELVEVSPAAGSNLKEDDEITFTVRVTNTGKYSGREVVQLYFTAPYTKGGIEKSSVVLAAFAKTSKLGVGESEVLTLKFSAFDMASYDYADKNGNGFKGYELENGSYQVKLMKNAHELDTVKENKHTVTYKVDKGEKGIQITNDPVSGGEIKNRFSEGSAEDGIAADGSETGENITYLTRADFAGTFPNEKRANREIDRKVKEYNKYTDARLENDLLDYPNVAITTNKNKGLKVFDNNDITKLGLELGGDYNSKKWDDVLNQMSIDEMKNLVLHGYVGTREVSSIGLPTTKATDGPAHIGSFGSVVNSPDDNTTAFPQPTVLAQTWNSRLAYTFGLAMGKEARLSNVDCWYGPGINLHRHPFGGRNYEYWSEDSVISGTMCAQAVKGALDAGVYSTIKHLALYNTDTYRDGQYVWLTEQNLRENYLKGFRIAIQQGGATGIMSSYNRIGAVWTGASSALQNSVLRGEFGFKGFIITDYSDHTEKTSLMIGDAMIRNGGDLWMDGWNSPGTFQYESKTPNRFNQALRSASKNIIYAYLNAAYQNDVYNKSGTTDVIIIERNNAKTSWWVYMVIGIDIFVFLCCAFWVYMAFFHRRVKARIRARKIAQGKISADTVEDGEGGGTDPPDHEGADGGDGDDEPPDGGDGDDEPPDGGDGGDSGAPSDDDGGVSENDGGTSDMAEGVGVDQATEKSDDEHSATEDEPSAQDGSEEKVGAMTKFKNKLVGFFGKLKPKKKDRSNMKSSGGAAVKTRRVQPKQILFFSIMALILVAVLVVDIICGVMSDKFSSSVSATEKVSQVTLAGADDVVREIENEGIVLLKNENNALPLRKRAINVFGWASTPAGFIRSGSGSGDASDRGGGAVEPVGFLDGLTKVGFRPNTELTKIYTKFKRKKDGTGASLNDRAEVFFKLYEPPRSVYTPAVMNQALAYSDTALIVISRSGGEGQDLPYFQSRAQGTTAATSGVDIDNTRTYLELSPQEEDLIDVVTKAGFKKVVVVINAMNVMELGFLDNAKIDAAISVGGPGQTGCISIAKVLHGTVTPSGKTTDTYAYDLSTAPSYLNSGSTGVKQYNGMWAEMEQPNQSNPGTSYIDYAESIYVGYKWYETADAEGYWEDRGGYNSVVQYPFGYGLSYTNFEWAVRDVSPAGGSVLASDGEIKFTVRVTNKGDYAGKDVVQLYYTPPYTKGGIEKSSVNLCAYAKTPLIEPKEHADVTLTFKVEDMKSYDCYDLNNNGNTGYELERGSYEVSLRKNAHEKANCNNNTVTYSVGETIYYKDGAGDTKIENRFTGENAYSGVSIDGITSGEGVTYLTRNDFAGTFPTTTPRRNKTGMVAALGMNWYKENTVSSAPKTGASGSYKLVSNGELNLDLVLELGSNYDDERWKPLVEQITKDELNALVEDAGFQTAKIDSVGKPRAVDLDGPAGLNLLDSSEPRSFTVYPVEVVLSATWNDELAFLMGQMVGMEAQEAMVSGWYAPGANIHRSPFNGRNFEYYSEDALLSGKMCANEVYGCLTKGMYSYMKHFVANETERQRTGLNTWLTEQALREIYLRPFEIAVKEGHANAMMTSFNCIGAVWTGGNKALLEDIVRGEWGFRGTMITDWSNGGDFMNLDQGLACGQDIWLNGGHYGAGGHNKKNTAAGISDMQRAAKNVLYTYCNSYYMASTAGEGVSLKTVKEEEKHYGWVAIVVVVNVVCVAGVAVWLFFTIRSIKKTKPEAAVEGDVSDNVDGTVQTDETATGEATTENDGVPDEAAEHEPTTDESTSEETPVEAAPIEEATPEDEAAAVEAVKSDEEAPAETEAEQASTEDVAPKRAAQKRSAPKKSTAKKSTSKKAQSKESSHEE